MDYFTKERSPHVSGASGAWEEWFVSFDAEYIKYWLALFSCLLSFTSVICVATWAGGESTAEGYLGGLDYDQLIINYHPVLMVTGMLFFGSLALLSFTVLPFSQGTNRVLHTLLHLSAIICLSTGIYYMRLAHTPEHNTEGTFKANYTSLHSWVGLVAVILYLVNFLGGLLTFVFQCGSGAFAGLFAMNHKNLGVLSLLVSVCAALTGTQMFSNCNRTVTSFDSNPAAHFDDLSSGCKVSNGMGMCILFSAILAVYVVLPQARSDDLDTNQIRYAPEHVAEQAQTSMERGGHRSKPGGNLPLPPMNYAHDVDILSR